MILRETKQKEFAIGSKNRASSSTSRGRISLQKMPKTKRTMRWTTERAHQQQALLDPKMEGKFRKSG
jgi:hypothetical protein